MPCTFKPFLYLMFMRLSHWTLHIALSVCLSVCLSCTHHYTKTEKKHATLRLRGGVAHVRCNCYSNYEVKGQCH